MNIQDIFYHGLRQQIRRCINAMTDVQIERGLTAFEDGESNWSNCFWARVFKGEQDLNTVMQYKAKDGKEHRGTFAIEWWIADRLGLESNMPVRIVYNIFDTMGKGLMTRAQLGKFINDVRFEENSNVDDVLRTLDLTNVQQTPTWDTENTCTNSVHAHA